jgi:formylglycine-generating enzyme required for sulfatase activity
VGNHPKMRNRKKWIGAAALFLAGLAGLAAWRSIAVVLLVGQVRWLERSADSQALAEALDRQMASIPAGEFWMGSQDGPQDEQPQRRILLDAYEIDRFETTNAQYRRFTLASGVIPPPYWEEDSYPGGQDALPVVGVSWNQAEAYCEWVGKRLPSEAEWEKACRGDSGSIYPWGISWPPNRANVGWSSRGNWPLSLEDGWGLLRQKRLDALYPGLEPVGSYLRGASEYGVFDLVGNASEWVLDWYTWQGYTQTPAENPVGAGPAWNHSVRGSGWFDRKGQEGLIADLSRCARRNSSHSHDDPRLGFRCARSLSAAKVK